MDWLMLFAGYASIVGSIGLLGAFLSAILKDGTKRVLGPQLAGLVLYSTGSRWIRGVNEAFLALFDRLFGSSYGWREYGAEVVRTPDRSALNDSSFVWKTVEQTVWRWLLITPATVGVLSLPSLITGGLLVVFGDATQSLVFAMSFGFAVASSSALLFGLPTESRGKRALWFGIDILMISFAGLGICLNHYGYLSGYVAIPLGSGFMFGLAIGCGADMLTRLSSRVRFDAAVVLAVLTIVVVGSVLILLIARPRWLGRVRSVLQGSLAFTIYVSILIVLTRGPFRAILRAVGRLVSRDLLSTLNPVKALASSLVFVFIVGLATSLIRVDVWDSLLNEFGSEGLILLVFVAYYVFACAISLAETRMVLSKAVDSGVLRLLALLVLDLIASALIFLVYQVAHAEHVFRFLPMVISEVSAFRDAMVFGGQRPWLGVLFWSTFSASVTFYLFVIASLLVRIFFGVVQLARFFDVEKQPVLVMTLAITLAITFLYWLAVASYAIVEAVA